MVYFLKGFLPWQGIKANNKQEKYNKIMEKKVILFNKYTYLNYILHLCRCQHPWRYSANLCQVILFNCTNNKKNFFFISRVFHVPKLLQKSAFWGQTRLYVLKKNVQRTFLSRNSRLGLYVRLVSAHKCIFFFFTWNI
jgi:hypothetical protein